MVRDKKEKNQDSNAGASFVIKMAKFFFFFFFFFIAVKIRNNFRQQSAVCSIRGYFNGANFKKQKRLFCYLINLGFKVYFVIIREIRCVL